MRKLISCLTTKKPSLIVFGARPGMGISGLSLKLANRLARQENVLFVSYKTYQEKLQQLVVLQGDVLHNSLTINTSLDFYDDNYEWDFNDSVDSFGFHFYKYDTIIIDDLDGFLGGKYEICNEKKNSIIKKFVEIAEENNLRIILNVIVSRKCEIGFPHKPEIQDFVWSRSLVYLADQIFSVFRPEYYMIFEDISENSLIDKIEIDTVKNGLNDDITITIDNINKKIIPRIPKYAENPPNLSKEVEKEIAPF